jgi:hypothetical protein
MATSARFRSRSTSTPFTRSIVRRRSRHTRSESGSRMSAIRLPNVVDRRPRVRGDGGDVRLAEPGLRRQARDVCQQRPRQPLARAALRTSSARRPCRASMNVSNRCAIRLSSIAERDRCTDIRTHRPLTSVPYSPRVFSGG